MKKYIRPTIVSSLIYILLLSIPYGTTLTKTIEVKKINGEKIQIDGKVDEPTWIFTDNSSDFIQRDPIEGEPVTESTSFSILYDDENLYVAIRALTDDNSTIKGILGKFSGYLFISFVAGTIFYFPAILRNTQSSQLIYRWNIVANILTSSIVRVLK